MFALCILKGRIWCFKSDPVFYSVEAKDIIIEKSDVEHETNARFDENILILDFNFDILYLQSARFDFS